MEVPQGRCPQPPSHITTQSTQQSTHFKKEREGIHTTGGHVTQFHAYVFILCEAPGPFHLPARVPAVGVPPSKLGEVCAAQLVAVGVLQCPRLALVPRHGGAHRPSVLRAGAVVALMVCRRGCVKGPTKEEKALSFGGEEIAFFSCSRREQEDHFTCGPTVELPKDPRVLHHSQEKHHSK